MLKFLVLAATLATATALSNKFTYQEGDVNVLLTAPHGGWTYQDGWPLRKHGCYDPDTDTCTFDSDPAACPEDQRDDKECRAVFLPDSYTKKMTKWVAEGMEALGYKPHYLINNIRRANLDTNREIEEAAQGFAGAEDAYNEYHDEIKDILNSLGSPGLLLDMHGNGHKTNMTEIGYLVSKYTLVEFMSNPDQLDKNYVKEQVPFHPLMVRNNVDVEEVIYGDCSLGNLIEGYGVRAMPSNTYKDEWPVDDEGKDYKYFKGGFTTQTYGSFKNSANYGWDAFQIEAPSEIRKSSILENYSKTVLAPAIVDFIGCYFQNL